MKAVISLGSNLENRKLNLDIAITQIESILDQLIVSPFIETKPVGGPVQDDFLNAVVIGDCDLTAEELLTAVPVEEAVRYLYEIAIDICDSSNDSDDGDSSDSDDDDDGEEFNSSRSDDRISTRGNKYQSGLFYRHNQLLNW